MGLPRYMAVARVDDAERTARHVVQLIGASDQSGPVCLLQCGKAYPLAAELGRLLNRLGRQTSTLTINDRAVAQTDDALGKLAAAGAVVVLSDDLLDAFFTVFATDVAFSLRARTKRGMPVVGIGQGALAMGGLLLANKVCGQAQYDLVSGLGWAPRVLLDGGAMRFQGDETIARTTVRTLPGLLAVDLGAAGGLRVEGGRLESIGSEPVRLLGSGNEEGSVLTLDLEPGRVTTIAPPPFAPFEERLLPPTTLAALSAEQAVRKVVPERAPIALRQAPSPEEMQARPDEREDHARPGSGRNCPMCKKIHAAESTLAAAA